MYPSQQNATDQTANFFWILVMIVGAMLLVWFFAPQWIVYPVFKMRLAEIDLCRWLFMGINDIGSFVNLPALNLSHLDHLQQYILNSNPHEVPFQDFAAVNVYVGHWIRYPIIAALLALAVLIHFKHAGLAFHTTYSMKTLRNVGQQNWPQITPALSIDLVKEDLDSGPWAMAKMPINFCKEHSVLRVGEDKKGKKIWTIDKGIASRLFSMQIGMLWKGPESLPIHMKALLVIFVARAEKVPGVSNKLMAQIAASAATGKLDFTGVEEQLQQLKNSKLLQWLGTRHAYTYTVMASMLEIARADGVLATAEFLWLKPVDRRLWYVLNSVGRQTAVVEAAGVFAHWLAERKLKRAVKTPMVKQAVEGLEEEIANVLYLDESDKWHTSNAA